MTADLNSDYRLHRGDARELKRTLEARFEDSDNLIDTIVTSPPYGDLIEYGDEKEQVGQQSYEEFLDDLRSIFKQCYELAAPECTLWIVSDTFRVGNRVVRLPFDLADDLENLHARSKCVSSDCSGTLHRDRGTGDWTCEACGSTEDLLAESWRMEDSIIWDKQRTRPWNQKGQFRNAHEYLTMFSKSDDFTYEKDAVRVRDTDEFQGWWVNYPERYNPKGIFPSNVWQYPIPKQGEWGPGVSYHPSPFPGGLVERIVKISSNPGDVVFDPFAGIGTTLAIAEALGRKPLGFELNEEYISYFEDHVRPKAIQDFATTQTKLRESTSDLEEIIFTLRIHKYAFELYSQLQDEENLAEGQPDVAFIHVTSDSEQFGSEDRPSAKIEFVTPPEAKRPASRLSASMDAMVSARQGSGDYYGVDFDSVFMDYSSYDHDMTTREELLASEGLFVYEAGIHNWARQRISLGDWASILRKETWSQFVSNRWPPLVSTLNIRVEDPMGESIEMTKGQQSGLGHF